jgi:hypothetical protein
LPADIFRKLAQEALGGKNNAACMKYPVQMSSLAGHDKFVDKYYFFQETTK